ncbi:MAG: Gfo/Idh/MocA family oxidoreductase [Alphaproteobacteria bacterium]|nr:Gfo/Idh/MocA family oxidoreductase [Alphaproteobacteria bacterium]
MSKLAIGIAGAGLIGRAHILRLQRSPACRLAAIADPAPAIRDAGFGVPIHADLETMLEEEKLDGVIVATPNAAHAPNALACIARGLPVLIEKPLAETAANGERIVEAAERAKVPVLVGHHRRHNPIMASARALIRGGELGRIATASAFTTFLKPAPYFDTAWRREPGGGPVLINLIHVIDDLRFLLGEIAEIQAMGSRALRNFPVEDSATAILRFASGALGTIALSDAAAAPWSWELTSGENKVFPRLPEDCYLVAGTEGSLAMPSLKRWRYTDEASWTAPLSMERLDVAHADPLDRQIAHFADVIRGEARPVIDGRDALQTLIATLTIHDQIR